MINTLAFWKLIFLSSSLLNKTSIQYFTNTAMINNLHTVLINKEICDMSCITKIHLIHAKSATLNT